MARFVNMHTAPLDNAHVGPKAARVPPGQVGDFAEGNPSVRLWLKAGMLATEGAVLASRAAALGDAPTAADALAMRGEITRLNTVIEDLHARLAARDAEAKRVEDAFGRQGAQIAELEAQLGAKDATIAALQKRVADLEADLATATAPAAGGDTTLDPKSPKAAKPRGS